MSMVMAMGTQTFRSNFIHTKDTIFGSKLTKPFQIQSIPPSKGMKWGIVMASRSWQEVSGETKWEGMLDPLDDDLRKFIIHCGERAEAIADAFNNDDVSPGCNFSRYPMDTFFSDVGLEINNPYKYEVKRFIYAKNLLIVGETTWIAYVAVATDEGAKALGRRDILVSWRGSLRVREILADINDGQGVALEMFPGDTKIKIHNGWHFIYSGIPLINKDEYTKKSARSQVLDEIESLIQTYSKEDISITVVGHSMGGALATLNGVDIVANGKNNVPGGDPCPVTVIPFSSPMVGNESFKEKAESLDNLHILRIVNVLDYIPHLPPVNYYPVGQKLQVDSRDCPDLVFLTDGASFDVVLGVAHDLEVLLQLVAGTNGIGNKFNQDNGRQLVLVNKNGDFLKTDVAIANQAPAIWWVVKNKGLVQDADGLWRLHDYKPNP